MIPSVTKPRRLWTTLPPLTIALGLMSALGCDEEAPPLDDAGTDAGVAMADAGDDAGGPPGTDGGLDASVDAGLADAGGTDAGSDAGMACGTDTVPLSMIRGTEGIAIAPDGTVYYSQSGALGRRTPGGSPENAWVSLGGSTTWGVAYRGDGILFVASPSVMGGTIFRIDPAATPPTATPLYTGAGAPNGLVIGPDDAVYYSDFSGGRVYRVDDAGARTEVTTARIPQPNGLLFDDDGTLLVLAYGDAEVHRLTLDVSMRETARTLVLSVAGARTALDGIGKDEAGRYYLTDNGQGRLLRYDASFGSEEVLLTGVPAAANLAFGRGALPCEDVYVTSSGTLARFAGDAAGRP